MFLHASFIHADKLLIVGIATSDSLSHYYHCLQIFDFYVNRKYIKLLFSKYHVCYRY